jgi:hypothetical protein
MSRCVLGQIAGAALVAAASLLAQRAATPAPANETVWRVTAMPTPRNWHGSRARPVSDARIRQLRPMACNRARLKRSLKARHIPGSEDSAADAAWAKECAAVGVFGCVFGLGFLLHSLSMVFMWTPLAFVLHAVALKRLEEPELELRFGPPYREYRQRVPMFIPRAPRRKNNRKERP